MTTSVGIVDSKGSICHAVGILLFLSSSKRLEEHRKPPPTKLPHSTLRSTVIHANIFILTVPFQSHFRHLPANGSRSLSHLKSSNTLGSPRKIAHKGTHGETRGVSDGGGITTLGPFRTFTNIPAPGVRTANIAAFGSWSGVLPKDEESLRSSDAIMRVAAPRRRGPAGLRNSVSVLLIMW